MTNCENCGRDFARSKNDSMTCPFCGYNTCAVHGGPRTVESVEAIERQRQIAEAEAAAERVRDIWPASYLEDEE